MITSFCHCPLMNASQLNVAINYMQDCESRLVLAMFAPSPHAVHIRASWLHGRSIVLSEKHFTLLQVKHRKRLTGSSPGKRSRAKTDRQVRRVQFLNRLMVTRIWKRAGLPSPSPNILWQSLGGGPYYSMRL